MWFQDRYSGVFHMPWRVLWARVPQLREQYFPRPVFNLDGDGRKRNSEPHERQVFIMMEEYIISRLFQAKFAGGKEFRGLANRRRDEIAVCLTGLR